ncbi:ORFL16W_IRL, partial [Human betaherpesvirus 5]
TPRSSSLSSPPRCRGHCRRRPYHRHVGRQIAAVFAAAAVAVNVAGLQEEMALCVVSSSRLPLWSWVVREYTMGGSRLGGPQGEGGNLLFVLL